jgi:hypothetical protein
MARPSGSGMCHPSFRPVPGPGYELGGTGNQQVGTGYPGPPKFDIIHVFFQYRAYALCSQSDFNLPVDAKLRFRTSNWCEMHKGFRIFTWQNLCSMCLSRIA